VCTRHWCILNKKHCSISTALSYKCVLMCPVCMCVRGHLSLFCVTLTRSCMMRYQWQCTKANLICTYSRVRWGRELFRGPTNCCLGICVHVSICVCCVFLGLFLCQCKRISEYLMHVFICVCLSLCDNKMSAKTEELMRPFFATWSGSNGVHKAMWALYLCLIITVMSNLCSYSAHY